MGKDKFCELEEESSRWLGVGRALVQEMFQCREAKGVGDVGVQEGDINSSHDGVWWEGVGRDRIVSRKWLVSWIWEGRDLTNGWRWVSKAETCSVGEPYEETMGQPGLPGLLVSNTNYLTPPQTTSAASLKLHTNLSSNPDTPPSHLTPSWLLLMSPPCTQTSPTPMASLPWNISWTNDLPTPNHLLYSSFNSQNLSLPTITSPTPNISYRSKVWPWAPVWPPPMLTCSWAT